MTTFADWLLTPHRVAIHLPSKTAVVADLHLGYHEARRQSGDAVPLADTAAALAPLALALRDAQSLVVAGDLFEKTFNALAWQDFHSVVRSTGVHFHGLVPGNHDRGLKSAPADLPILPDGFLLGGWRILHGTNPLPDEALVLGHLHPCVTVRGRKTPCYLAGPRRLILPAYSKDAAGADIRRLQAWREKIVVKFFLVDSARHALDMASGGRKSPETEPVQ